MNEKRAREIFQSLVQGIDPLTGSQLPSDSVLQQAEVLRALLLGIHALDDREAREQRRAQLPRNIGRSWSAEEQQQLVDAYQAGEPLSQIAERHGRTLRGIESRLEKLGLLKPEDRQTKDRFPTDEQH